MLTGVVMDPLVSMICTVLTNHSSSNWLMSLSSIRLLACLLSYIPLHRSTLRLVLVITLLSLALWWTLISRHRFPSMTSSRHLTIRSTLSIGLSVGITMYPGILRLQHLISGTISLHLLVSMQLQTVLPPFWCLIKGLLMVLLLAG